MKFTRKFPGRRGFFWAMGALHGSWAEPAPEPVKIVEEFDHVFRYAERIGYRNPFPLDGFLWGDEIVRPEVEEVKT
ncbi:MAG: hypothetical protein LUQ69_10645 [Methanoregulaceae archaeon]|nr:hypothetical protein [Methanoregulaceae archaeon]